MTSQEIRQKFLDFFAAKEHLIVPSAPIVVKNDPTLLFTNAGMNQFKDYFLGNSKPARPRIADTQKCLRVSGKHNDLEEVGVDTYHHTMFEMLGNWSFGNYFKKEAIAWSWELLTKEYGLDAERLYVTVFEGDDKLGLPQDFEALEEWKKVIAEDRILYGNKKDNFWEMGDTGPCGPCTEIHFDSRSDEERKAQPGKQLVNADHPQVIEIWNNVFIQFNRLKDGSLEMLPDKHVDTGMGLERLVRVMQGKQSNYDTDIFTPTIALTEQLVNKSYDAKAIPSDRKQWMQAVAFRVMADHIRAISFTIADGQLPSNTGAGYVIRRILRRAVRYYFSYLDYKHPLLYKLVPLLAAQFENVFPELKKQEEFVAKVIKEEEEGFLRTLEKGLRKFDELTNLGEGDKVIAGKSAFELSDTFGFPIDLTELIARERGWTVDIKGFEAARKEQQERARKAGAIDSEDWVVLDDFFVNEFVGYDSLEIKTRVVKYRKVKAKGKEVFQVALEATPFYAESGGQVGDTGVLLFGDEAIDVIDTRKENDLVIHVVERLPKDVQSPVLARVNAAKRHATTIHHTATHLLHAALRKVLGTHVAQKGSLVNDEYLRFDFSHFAKVSDEELGRIEALVNEKIRENILVVIKTMKKDEAIATGAMALFGEKYGDEVRVVIIDPAYSIELCGGTHVDSTGSLGFFKIQAETAVGAGVRRIEAVCGRAAEHLVLQQFHLAQQVRELLKSPKDIAKALTAVLNENQQLRKQLESLEAKRLSQLEASLLQSAEQLNGTNFLGAVVEVSNAEHLKKLCFDLRKSLPEHLVVLAANLEGKPSVAVMVDENVISRTGLEATKIIKEHVAPLIKGGGGGQKTLATAGGQDASNLQLVLEKVKALIS